MLDVMMPGPDGLALCRGLRRDGDFSVPVILLTALGEEGRPDRRAGGGRRRLPTKPFSPRELALRVRSVLRRAPVATAPAVVTSGALTCPAARAPSTSLAARWG
ncbi:MAG: hypothetical protein U0R77_00095 [Mycolicibacterium insubricum]